MFTNLIENALLHTPRATSVGLALRAEADAVIAEVRDNGPGVPIEDRENVLKRFYRLDVSRTSVGAGLGLALAAAIADLHGAHFALGDAHPGLCAKISW